MPGPWEADAAAYFGENPEAIAAFDRYMTEKQQPYVTQLEEGSKDARELWTDLNADPATAVRDLVASVYANDPELIAHYDAYFAPPEDATPPPAAVTPPPTDEVPEWAKPLVEDHAARRDREAKEAAEADYVKAKADLRTAHADLTDNDISIIDPFVYSAGGDMEKAYVALRAWQKAAGVPQPEPTPEPTPPPVLEGGRPAPPLATKYTSYGQIGAALREYSDQQRASATPPPVLG